MDFLEMSNYHVTVLVMEELLILEWFRFVFCYRSLA